MPRCRTIRYIAIMTRGQTRFVFLAILAVLFLIGILRLLNIPLGFRHLMNGDYPHYRELAKASGSELPEVLARVVQASVVHVTAQRKARIPSPFPGIPEQTVVQQFQGSGVVVDPDGYILTNAHVVENAREIRVKLLDGRELPATRIGLDTLSDVAVLRVSNGKLSAMRLADSDKAVVGEWVYAIGSPFGYAHSMTGGIVSGLARNMEQDFIQTDASINQGNSGGALVNLAGELVGINTAIFAEQGASVGIGFAIPANVARKVSLDLIRHGRVRRGWLGVEMQEVDSRLAQALGAKVPGGVLVSSVVNESPAQKAGLKQGDLILKAGQREIHAPSDLYVKVAYSDPGSTMNLVVFRNDKESTLKVKLGERPKEQR